MLDEALAAKLESLPQAPGCYIMRDREGTIVYVGKAVNLRSRVRQYFTKTDTRAFVQVLDDLLGDIEVILTTTEKEALLLENELIKKHHPRFNVLLRDDKNFISLRLDVRQPYPRLEVVRRIRKDGARYFGPYSSAGAIRETLRLVNRHFHLRTCSDSVMANRRRPCLQYQINRCPGPCVYDVPKEDYGRSIEDVSMFLAGKTDDLTVKLRERMKTAAKELRFEDASRLRDQAFAVERSLEKQRSVDIEPVDRDVFAIFREGPLLLIQILFVRNGKLTGERHFTFKGQEFPDEELIDQFLSQYYDSGAFLPREVLLPLELPNSAVLEEWLTERKGERVYVLAPQRGEKQRLLEMAAENAAHNFQEWRNRNTTDEESLARLQKRLRLTRIPHRIECYDNSHLMGTLAVGSRVTFVDGEPDKSLYRHYKVRTASGDDDFQMMFEVLTRRLSRGVAENDLPDLIVVDGGKGQLNVARTVLAEQKLTRRIDLCSLAKGRVVDDEKLFASRQGFTPEEFKIEDTPTADAEPLEPIVPIPKRTGRSRNRGRYKKGEVEHSPERVFLPGQKNPIVLRANSAELFLLQRLRDEAHRFAIEFQRKLRRGANFRSVLREIPGVGDTRQRALLRHFGSLRRVREATAEEIAKVEGFPENLAQEVWRFLRDSAQPARIEVAAAPADAGKEAEELALEDAGMDGIDAEPSAETDLPENAAVLAEVEAEVESEASIPATDNRSSSK